MGVQYVTKSELALFCENSRGSMSRADCQTRIVNSSTFMVVLLEHGGVCSQIGFFFLTLSPYLLILGGTRCCSRR